MCAGGPASTDSTRMPTPRSSASCAIAPGPGGGIRRRVDARRDRATGRIASRMTTATIATSLEADLPADERRWLVLDADAVLGLDLHRAWEASDDVVETPVEVSALVAERDAARRARDYARADALRDEIGAAGFDVIDDASGSTDPSAPLGAPPVPDVPDRRRASTRSRPEQGPATRRLRSRPVPPGGSDRRRRGRRPRCAQADRRRPTRPGCRRRGVRPAGRSRRGRVAETRRWVDARRERATGRIASRMTTATIATTIGTEASLITSLRAR